MDNNYVQLDGKMIEIAVQSSDDLHVKVPNGYGFYVPRLMISTVSGARVPWLQELVDEVQRLWIQREWRWMQSRTASAIAFKESDDV